MASKEPFVRNQLYSIPLKDLQPDPDQPRKYLDPAALDELTASVTQHGVLEPILFRRDAKTGLLYVVAGERRCAAALCRLSRSLDENLPALSGLEDTLLAALKQALYRKASSLLDPKHLGDRPFLPDQTLAGYVYLQAGELNPAVAALQAALPYSPQNAHVYGCLGDAYTRRGDQAVARRCYLEAFLIDPGAVDWQTFQDDDLLALKRRLQTEEGMDAIEAAHWLAPYAYVAGIFRPKEIKQLDEMKTFVADYQRLEKACGQDAEPFRQAGLFLRAIILCDNESFLRMIKGIDFADVRQHMKSINVSLFSAYLKHVEGRKRPRSEQRRY